MYRHCFADKAGGTPGTTLLAGWQLAEEELIHQWGHSPCVALATWFQHSLLEKSADYAQAEHIEVEDHLCRRKNLANSENRGTSNEEMTECADLQNKGRGI